MQLKNQVTSIKIEPDGRKTAKYSNLYAQFSQKLFLKSKPRSLNAAHNQKTSLAQKN